MPPPIPEFAGNGGQLVEYDWEGNVVWEYREPYHSHCFAPLMNGNLLISKWERVPDAIARRVCGGQPGAERNGAEMWAEALQEIDRAGEVVWEWRSAEHLDPEADAIGPLHPRDRWTNLNSLQEMPDGRILVSYRCINAVAIINRATGGFDWKWGPGVVAGQHNPPRLENGNSRAARATLPEPAGSGFRAAAAMSICAHDRPTDTSPGRARCSSAIHETRGLPLAVSRRARSAQGRDFAR